MGLSDFTLTKIIQCKVEVDRKIEYCGMHSHTSAVINGYKKYIQDVSRDQCNKMHKTGVFLASINTHITGLRVNKTSSHAIKL